MLVRNKNAKLEVPIIHFIWAGGKNLMPLTNCEVVLKWAAHNPGLRIFLWVDKVTFNSDAVSDADNMPLLVSAYDRTFNQNKLGLKVRIISRDNKAVDAFAGITIELKDITDEGIVNPHIRYEIDKLRPCYGASSDLLRYTILVKYGYFYFDSDVEPATLNEGKQYIKPKSLKSFYKETLESLTKDYLYIEHLTQKPNARVTLDDLAYTQNGASRIGNDSFICSKDNPVMLEVCESVVAIRDTVKEDKGFGYLAELQGLDSVDPIIVGMTYGGRDINMTIALTGPEIIKAVLAQEATGTIVATLRNADYCLTSPKEENDQNWNKVILNSSIVSIEGALEQAKKDIAYEAKHFSIIRLYDHLTYLNAYAKKFQVDPGMLAKKLIEGVYELIAKNEINLSVIKSIQCLLLNDEIEGFYDASLGHLKGKLLDPTLSVKYLNYIFYQSLGIGILNWMLRSNTKDINVINFNLGITRDGIGFIEKLLEHNTYDVDHLESMKAHLSNAQQNIRLSMHNFPEKGFAEFILHKCNTLIHKVTSLKEATITAEVDQRLFGIIGSVEALFAKELALRKTIIDESEKNTPVDTVIYKKRRKLLNDYDLVIKGIKTLLNDGLQDVRAKIKRYSVSGGAIDEKLLKLNVMRQVFERRIVDNSDNLTQCINDLKTHNKSFGKYYGSMFKLGQFDTTPVSDISEPKLLSGENMLKSTQPDNEALSDTSKVDVSSGNSVLDLLQPAKTEESDVSDKLLRGPKPGVRIL